MDQLPEGTFIAAERVCTVKVDKTLPADGTQIVFVQRIIVHEGGPARSAEEFRFERLGQGEAGGANRDPRNSYQRLLTQPTLVGEDEIEKDARKALGSRHQRLRPEIQIG